MPTRSSFADARTIRDIGSPLPVDLGGKPYDREEHHRAAERWRERSESPLPPAVENPGFFGNNMFDTTVLAIEFAPEFVRITVDEDDTPAFVSALSGILEQPRPRRPWPVDLTMHEPTFVRAVAHDGTGDLHTVTLDSRNASEGSRVGVLPNEWFFEWEGRLGWVAELWGVDVRSSGAYKTVHLLVDCARASATDRRLDALIAVYGPAVAPLWREARSEFREGPGERFFWLPEDLEDFLAARMAAHGLTRADFR